MGTGHFLTVAVASVWAQARNLHCLRGVTMWAGSCLHGDTNISPRTGLDETPVIFL
jgi:hypothetical protein